MAETDPAAEAAAREDARARDAIARLQARVAADAALPLQEGTRTRLMLQPGARSRGVVVLLHGWSAGTYQYDELAPLVFAQGKHVYIPRLEGHGFRTPDGEADPSHLVGPRERTRYHAFAEQVFRDIRGLGAVQLVGLSGGATVALDIAAHHPEVQRVVAMSPYLGTQDARADGLFRSFEGMDAFSFGQASRILEAFQHDWGEGPPDGPGHWKHSVGGIYALSCYGRAVTESLRGLQVPVQLITSRGDRAASRRQFFRAYDLAGGDSRHGWFDFETIGHPMLSKHNNPDAASIRVLTRITLDFLESGKRVGARPQR